MKRQAILFLILIILSSLAGCSSLPANQAVTPIPTTPPEQATATQTASATPTAVDTVQVTATPTKKPSKTPRPTRTPAATQEKRTYPALGLDIKKGQHGYTSDKANLNFLLYLPDAYFTEANKKWPLILFLHGSGERGNNLVLLKVGGLVKNLETESDFPFIVVSPQLEGKKTAWSEKNSVKALFTLIEEIQAVYSIDPKRIYLAGFSLGGAGVWEIGLSHPQRFAALVPVSGFYGSTSYGNSLEVPKNICDLKDTPIWAFHGAEDPVIPVKAEQVLVDALKECEGKVRMTVYPGGRHDITNEVFADTKLYEWLMKQKLK